MVFVPGTRTILVFGGMGLGPFCYGDGSGDHDNPPGTLNNDGAENCGDPCSTPFASGKGPHSYGGANYTGFIMAYDANDMVSVLKGLKPPWGVTPYGFWPVNLPFDGCGTLFGGVTYDAVHGLIYATTIGSDTEAPYSFLPLIQVFQIASAALVPPNTPPGTTPPGTPGKGHEGSKDHGANGHGNSHEHSGPIKKTPSRSGKSNNSGSHLHNHGPGKH